MSVNKNLIAQNTVFLFFRMLVTMAITLYTSRVVLQVLGVEDFGIYNVVAGFVGMLAFFQSSLSSATQRYLNLALGANDQAQANKVFNQSLSIYAFLALLILLLGITFGAWFLNAKLNIPPTRLTAANITLVLSLLTTGIIIVQVPYSSLIIAHERMSMYAYLSITEVVVKLGLVFFLNYVDIDKLTLYSLLMLLGSVVIFALNIIYCKFQFKEAYLKWVWDRHLIKEMTSFLGKNVYAAAVWALGSQGYNILLNLFFTPVANAARGVANQVNNTLMRFCETVFTATRPQMIKSFAQNDTQSLLRLMEMSTKIASILFVLTVVPLCLYINEILDLWLVEVPEGTAEYVRIYFLDALLVMFFVPMTNVTVATGNVKRSLVYGKSLPLLGFCIALFFYKNNLFYTPALVYYLLVFTDALYFFYMMYDLHQQLGFNVRSYVRTCFMPVVITLIVSYAIGVLFLKYYRGFQDGDYMKIVMCMVLTSSVTILMSIFMILQGSERKVVFSYVNKIIKRKGSISTHD